MEIKFLLLVSIVCVCASTVTTEVMEQETGVAHDGTKVLADAVSTAVESEHAATSEVAESKGKSSLEATEAITLYRHDQAAGVYRTASGDLVRMYRVAEIGKFSAAPSRKAMPGKRRALPMSMKQRNGEDGMTMSEGPKQRMFGDWFSNYYNGGMDPYSSTYSYNYQYGMNPMYSNYGYGGYPYGAYGGSYYPGYGYTNIYG